MPNASGEAVSTSAATLPKSSSLRSARATADPQCSQTVTKETLAVNATGAPQEGQGASVRFMNPYPQSHDPPRPC
jgi:hypothetical protein